jgi:2-polyprenyl-3-methyl-5-hydroxy-6-metoxy-1,4-benzoquinol methylase
MQKGQYFPGQSSKETEEQRLRLLESIRDPETICRMKELGVAPGWRCLEVGAGRGSIACWLAERIVPTGHVVATDIDVRFLEQIRLTNLEVRRHDVCENDFEPSAYDLVHCRDLLVHVPKPEEALARMAKAVRSGGWLFVEEPDFGSFGCVDPAYPGAAEFDRSMRVILDVAQAAGVMRTYFGRRLPGLVERLGFENFGYEGTVRRGRAGDQLVRFYSLSVRSPGARERLIAMGVQTREQLDHVLHMYDDPSFEFVGPTIFAAWARRP